MIEAALESVLRRDRMVVVAALVMVTALAWAYVLWLAADMEMGGMDMTGFRMIAAGYLLTWIGFALAATVAQWALEQYALLTPMMESVSNIFGGIVLIAAGL